MNIKPIRTKSDYRAALAEIETLMTAKARTVLADGGIGQNRAEALIAAILALPDDAPVRSLALFPQAKAGATPGMNDV